MDAVRAILAEAPGSPTLIVAALWVAGGAALAWLSYAVALRLWRTWTGRISSLRRRPTPARPRRRMLRGVGAGLLLGPITGPLFLGFVDCVRAKRPWMASVYVLAIVETVIGLPLILKAELDFVSALT